MEDNSRPTGLVAIEGRGKPIDLPKIEASPGRWSEKAKNIFAKWGRIVAPALFGIANITNPAFAASNAPEINPNKAVPVEVQPVEKSPLKAIVDKDKKANETTTLMRSAKAVDVAAIDYTNADEINKAITGYRYQYDKQTKELTSLDEVVIEEPNKALWLQNAESNITAITQKTGRSPEMTYIFTNGLLADAARNTIVSLNQKGQNYVIMWPAAYIEGKASLSTSPSEWWFSTSVGNENIGYAEITLPSGYEPTDIRVKWIGDTQIVELQPKNDKGLMVFNPLTGVWTDMRGPLPDVLARPSAAMLEKAISPFALAYKLDVETTNLVMNNLQEKMIAGEDGKEYRILLTSIPQDKIAKNSQYTKLQNIPLMIAQKLEDGSWKFEKVDNSKLLSIKNIKFGIAPNLSDDSNNQNWINMVYYESSIIVPRGGFPPRIFSDWPTVPADWMNISKNAKAPIRVNNGFWNNQGYDISPNDPILSEKDPSKIELFMRNYIRKVLLYKPDQINIVLEPWQYRNNSIIWNNSIYYKAFGEDWPLKAFQIAQQELDNLKKIGAIPNNKNIEFYWNDWGIDQLGKNNSTLFSYIQKMQAAGIKIDGVGLQIRPGVSFYPHIPTEKDLVDSINEFKKLGLKVYLEYLVYQAQGNTHVEEVMKNSVNACIQTKCDDLVIWDQLDRDKLNPVLLNKDYSYGLKYFNMSKYIFEAINSQN